MLQRIQSVYLFIAGVLMLIGLFLPVMHLTDDDEPLGIVYNGFARFGLDISYLPICLAFFIVLGIGMVTYAIFLYRDRLKQVKFCRWSIVLIVAYYILFGALYFYYDDTLGRTLSLNISACLPFVALIFCYLAIKRIMKDERLVRAADRIR